MEPFFANHQVVIGEAKRNYNLEDQPPMKTKKQTNLMSFLVGMLVPVHWSGSTRYVPTTTFYNHIIV